MLLKGCYRALHQVTRVPLKGVFKGSVIGFPLRKSLKGSKGSF